MSSKDFPLEVRVLVYLFILDLISIPFFFFIVTGSTGDPQAGLISVGVQACIAVLIYVIGWTLGRQTVELRDPRLQLWDQAGAWIYAKIERLNIE